MMQWMNIAPGPRPDGPESRIMHSEGNIGPVQLAELFDSIDSTSWQHAESLGVLGRKGITAHILTSESHQVSSIRTRV